TPIYLERSSTYEDEMVRLTMDIELLKEIEKATDRPLPEINAFDLMPLLIGTQFQSTLAEMISDMQDLLQKRNSMAVEATGENITVQGLEHQIEVQKQMILESIKNLRLRAETRRQELS